MNTQRIYDNKLSTNIKDLDKELKKDLLKQVKSLMSKIATMNEKKKQLVIVTTSEERDLVKSVIARSVGVDAETISNSMLNKAILSGMKNKMIVATRNNKVEGWSYSVSDFLKSINASIVKKLAKAE